MTLIGLDDIKSKVRLTLDEMFANESEYYSGADDSEIDAIILSKAREALRFVHGNAEVSLLDAEFTLGSAEALTPVSRGDKSYIPMRVSLPENFLRLVKAYCSEWKRVFTDHLTFDSPEYALQGDYLSMGTPDRPVLFIDRPPASRDYSAEFYSVKSATAKFSVEILLEPELFGGGYYVSDKLVDAYIYYLSGLVLLVLSDSHADDCFNMSNVLMGVSAQQANQ